MRVTNASLMNRYLSDVQTNLKNMNDINTQINTQQQVNKVSDDPYKAIKIMNLKSEMSGVDKYNYNCDEMTGWLDITDGALDSIGSLTSEIKTKLTSIQDTLGKDEIDAIRLEVNEKVKQIAEAMNSTYAGKYVFGGANTDEGAVSVSIDKDGNPQIYSIYNKPDSIPADPGSYSGSSPADSSNPDYVKWQKDTDEYNKLKEANKTWDQKFGSYSKTEAEKELKAQISDGIIMDYNLTLKDITGTSVKDTDGHDQNGIELLNNMVVGLNDIVNGFGKTDSSGKIKTTLSEDDLKKINNFSSNLTTFASDILDNRSIVGAKTNIVSDVKDNNNDDLLQMKAVYSEMQDTDVVQKFVELQQANMVYTASLQVGAKLIKPTLMDYV